MSEQKWRERDGVFDDYMGDSTARSGEAVQRPLRTPRAEHSKAPWTYHTRLTASENHKGFFIVGHGSTWALADVQPGDEHGWLGEANARLIAASPDLLRELKGALMALEAHGFTQSAATARAAIAKAEAA